MLRRPVEPKTRSVNQEPRGGQTPHRAAVQAFASFGTLVAVAKLARIEDLPVHVYRAEDEVCSTGPSDRLLTDAEIERLKGLGLIPVAAVRGRDLATIMSFRSVTGAPLF